MVNSMFGGEITPSPGPGLFGIVQDPLGALGELVFGHPQAGRSIHHFHDLHVIFVGKKTCWLPRNWRVYFRFGKELGPICGLVELLFIILQLQIHKHHDQV